MTQQEHYNSTCSAKEDVLSEQGRLKTFSSWPHSAAVEPAVLARAGFYYLGQSDRVRCAFCGGTLKSWRHGDDPHAEHIKNFRHCPFVQGLNVGNIPLISQPVAAASLLLHSEHGSHSSVIQGEDIGPVPLTANYVHLNPCHPDFQTLDSRLCSFFEKEWPSGISQQPETLAEAGFFFTGYNDGVRCFCCDGALRNWEPGDDPWMEHARWFPRCPYLRQQKGLDFIKDIQTRQVLLQRVEQARMSPLPSPATARYVQTQEPVSSLPMVREVLEMGFDPEKVNETVEQLISSSGRPPDLQVLINALLNENSERGQGLGEGRGINIATFTNAGLTPMNSVTGIPSAPSQEDEASRDRILCKICMDKEVSVTFLPCGHLVCCFDCAKLVKECPVCRQTVRASIRTYLC